MQVFAVIVGLIALVLNLVAAATGKMPLIIAIPVGLNSIGIMLLGSMPWIRRVG